MKNKGSKLVGANWMILGLPSIFLLCIFFFLAGFFGSSLFSQQEASSTSLRHWPRELQEEKKKEFDGLPRGETGEVALISISFQILSWNPRALYFPNFASAEQCKSIIETAKEHLEPSSLALREGETAENTKGIRTSASEDKTGILHQIEAKIAKGTMIPRTHGEAFNVLRYEVGQRYHSHYDAFNPAEYGPQKSQKGNASKLVEFIHTRFSIASFLLYLSDVEEGGETMFPLENGLNMDATYDYRKCMGMKVKPHQGDALLFYSLFPNDISSWELSGDQWGKMGSHKMDQGSRSGRRLDACPLVRALS